MLAAALVVVFGSIVFARRAGAPDLRIVGKASGTPTPTAERPGAAASAGPRTGFSATGTWVMSSLPGCFIERERIRGKAGALRAALPPAADRLRPPAVVTAGACTITVRERELWIARGADVLRVPPEARLYREGDHLTLVTEHGGQVEIRRYERQRFG